MHDERSRRHVLRRATALRGGRRSPAAGEDEILVDVLAAGLHPRVRSGAAGTHYTSTGRLPMIPGVDGVGRRPDGRSCISSPTTTAARWPTRRSSTRAVRSSSRRRGRRARCGRDEPGDVLVGRAAPTCTDRAGPERARPRRDRQRRNMAVQIAKLLGAGRVSARAGSRAPAGAPGTGADEVVQLSGDATETAERSPAPRRTSTSSSTTSGRSRRRRR